MIKFKSENIIFLGLFVLLFQTKLFINNKDSVQNNVEFNKYYVV